MAKNKHKTRRKNLSLNKQKLPVVSNAQLRYLPRNEVRKNSVVGVSLGQERVGTFEASEASGDTNAGMYSAIRGYSFTPINSTYDAHSLGLPQKIALRKPNHFLDFRSFNAFWFFSYVYPEKFSNYILLNKNEESKFVAAKDVLKEKLTLEQRKQLFEDLTSKSFILDTDSKTTSTEIADIKAKPTADRYAMIFLEGENLAEFRAKNKKNILALLKAIIACGDALQQLHTKKVIHGDIRAHNFMLKKSLENGDYEATVIDMEVSRFEGEKIILWEPKHVLDNPECPPEVCSEDITVKVGAHESQDVFMFAHMAKQLLQSIQGVKEAAPLFEIFKTSINSDINARSSVAEITSKLKLCYDHLKKTKPKESDIENSLKKALANQDTELRKEALDKVLTKKLFLAFKPMRDALQAKIKCAIDRNKKNLLIVSLNLIIQSFLLQKNY